MLRLIVRETELQPFFAFHGLTSDGVDQFGRPALQNLLTNAQQFLQQFQAMGRFGRTEMGFWRRQADLDHRLS